MPTIRVFDNIRQVYIEQEYEEQPAVPPTAAELEQQYKARVAELIHEVYPIDREAGLVGETLKDMSEGLPVSEEFLAYRAYVEQCKDRAYAEAYGRARG